MLLNIVGPSGSGKTTLIRELLKKNKTHEFFEEFTNKESNQNLNKKISISLIPLPVFRGTIEEFFMIFSININDLLNLNNQLLDLAESIFGKIVDEKSLFKLSKRSVETFSAGEMRRLFILKSLIIKQPITIIDEPLSNSDEKLWSIIFSALQTMPRTIILSHLSLENLITSNDKYKSIHIDEVRLKFKI
jgi:ABC-type Mn2+/Zn2+ transport system ATPase subunit